MPARRRRSRAVALVTSLILCVVMLLLGVGYLYFLERDNRFAAMQEWDQQAYYMALAGLQYQRVRSDLLYPNDTQFQDPLSPGTQTPPNLYATMQVSFALPVGQLPGQYRVSVDKDGNVTSTGWIQVGSSNVSRTLVVPAPSPDPAQPPQNQPPTLPLRDYVDTSQ